MNRSQVDDDDYDFGAGVIAIAGDLGLFLVRCSTTFLCARGRLSMLGVEFLLGWWEFGWKLFAGNELGLFLRAILGKRGGCKSCKLKWARQKTRCFFLGWA